MRALLFVSSCALLAGGTEAGTQPPMGGPYAHRVELASSPDGFSFTLAHRTPLEHPSVLGTVAPPDERLRVYYADASRESEPPNVHEAGIHPPVPGGRQVANPFVVQHTDDTWKMISKTGERPMRDLASDRPPLRTGWLPPTQREPDTQAESDRDPFGYHALSRSYQICAGAGVRVVAFNEERSFAALWTPPDFRSGRVMALLHGTGGTAYDEVKDELPAARKHGYMLVSLQWFNRETRRYLDAPVVYRLMDRALHYAAERHKADLNKVALCGFSRGGAVSYEVAWRDARDHRHFQLVICHSGGVPLDAVVAPGEGWHPDRFFSRLNSGRLGRGALKGCHFFLYSGDRDEEWGTKMSQQMAHAQRVLTQAGATVVEWVRDPRGGHMGYRTQPHIHEKAIQHFLRLTGNTRSKPARGG